MAEFTENDLDRIELEWERIFGERMPWRFQIGPAQLPVLRRCIEQRSMQPLKDYLRSIPDDTAYCKNDLPIADLAPHTPEDKQRLGFSRVGWKFPMKPFSEQMRKSKACSTGTTTANPNRNPFDHH